MGAWGTGIFENDDACDWAFGLADSKDLSLVSDTIARVLAHRGHVEAPTGSEALAACEVVARALGRPGTSSAYTEGVDAWVARVRPQASDELQEHALRAIERVMGSESELAELWAEGEPRAWKECLTDLRARLVGP